MHVRHHGIRIAAIGLLAAFTVTALPGTAHADDIRDSQWYLKDFDIDKVHELSQGEGVKVGILDTGSTPDHSDLDGNVEATSDDAGAGGDGSKDDVGHGTAVSSVIAGHGHGSGNSSGILGIAPKATVLSVDLFDLDDPPYADPLPGAIYWLVDNGADVISISLSDQKQYFSEQAAIDYAVANGVPVVVSAGNHDPEPAKDFESNDTQWPAKAHNVIPVSGTTHGGEFWDWGSLNLHNADPFPALGISAPADDIPVAAPDGGYDTMMGTSFAAPIVVGTLALLRSAFPDLTYDQLVYRLLATADDKGADGFDDEYGWGLVDPYQALTTDVAAPEDDPFENDRSSTAVQRAALDDQGSDVGAPPEPDEPEATGNIRDMEAADQAAEADAADGGPELVGTQPTWPKWKVGFVMIDAVVVVALIGFGWWWFRRLIRRRRAGRAPLAAASRW